MFVVTLKRVQGQIVVSSRHGSRTINDQWCEILFGRCPGIGQELVGVVDFDYLAAKSEAGAQESDSDNPGDEDDGEPVLVGSDPED